MSVVTFVASAKRSPRMDRLLPKGPAAGRSYMVAEKGPVAVRPGQGIKGYGIKVWVSRGIRDTGIRDTGYGIPGYGIWDTGIRDMGYGIWDTGIRDMGYRDTRCRG